MNLTETFMTYSTRQAVIDSFERIEKLKNDCIEQPRDISEIIRDLQKELQTIQNVVLYDCLKEVQQDETMDKL